MPKPVEQMTAKEIEVRLREIQVEEAKLWCQVRDIRYEKAQLELAQANAKAGGR